MGTPIPGTGSIPVVRAKVSEKPKAKSDQPKEDLSGLSSKSNRRYR